MELAYQITMVFFIFAFVLFMASKIKEYFFKHTIDGYLTSIICLAFIGVAVGGVYLIYLEGF